MNAMPLLHNCQLAELTGLAGTVLNPATAEEMEDAATTLADRVLEMVERIDPAAAYTPS